ncbi:hypothetical protein RJ639_042348 [Escallonia herrerae]|uniref:Pectin acetylesterase n=1 Tax=Escallonia herrerae TaxID=1293975 RepID=A0AA88WIX4_9ASTE|nr:hypothetical protein RJ639_042348 [Escallonia herrerae]
MSRMISPTLGQCVCMLFCLVILVKAEDSGVNITIVDNAVATGAVYVCFTLLPHEYTAVCPDGSPPAYHFDKGAGDGANSWLVHLEGGAWCESTQSCVGRMKQALGSSIIMEKMYNFSGILDGRKELNPEFHDWNRIFVRYCDGSSFTGDVEEVDPATNLHFRGARIFQAVMQELLGKGMNNASNALLTGCSAGGLASILHCDNFRELMPATARVKCASDAGFFLHAKDYAGGNRSEDLFYKVVQLHRSAANLPPSCTSKMEPTLCFYPQYVVPQIQTPLFILNSAFDTYQIQHILTPRPADDPGLSFQRCSLNYEKCSPRQTIALKGFGLEFIITLARLGTCSSRGLFINSCFAHCQSTDGKKWYGDVAEKLGNKAMAKALGDWYHDRSGFQQIDFKHDLPQSCT